MSLAMFLNPRVTVQTWALSNASVSCLTSQLYNKLQYTEKMTIGLWPKPGPLAPPSAPKNFQFCTFGPQGLPDMHTEETPNIVIYNKLIYNAAFHHVVAVMHRSVL